MTNLEKIINNDFKFLLKTWKNKKINNVFCVCKIINNNNDDKNKFIVVSITILSF